jgi:hypothetical protein
MSGAAPFFEEIRAIVPPDSGKQLVRVVGSQDVALPERRGGRVPAVSNGKPVDVSPVIAHLSHRFLAPHCGSVPGPVSSPLDSASRSSPRSLVTMQ